MTGGAFDTADHPAYHQKHYDACRDKKDSFVDESQVRNWPGDHPRELNDEDEALVELLLPVATVRSMPPRKGYVDDWCNTLPCHLV